MTQLSKLKFFKPYERLDTAPGISFGNEPFRENVLFDRHAFEVRGRPFAISWGRYAQLEAEERLVWIVARDFGTGHPVGYSGHYWYVDLHFSDKVAADDLWYVSREWRGKGIGRRLREIGLSELRAMGVTATYDHIREGGPDLAHLGYERWGQRWKRTL